MVFQVQVDVGKVRKQNTNSELQWCNSFQNDVITNITFPQYYYNKEPQHPVITGDVHQNKVLATVLLLLQHVKWDPLKQYTERLYITLIATLIAGQTTPKENKEASSNSGWNKPTPE